MEAALQDYLNYETAKATTEAKKTSMKKQKEKEVMAELPEFNQLRDMVSHANNFVDNLEKCSDNFRLVINRIKDNLKKANLLVAALEKAQRDAVLEMLEIDWSDAAVQEKQEDNTQTVYLVRKKNKQRQMYLNIARVAVVISVIINCLLFAAAVKGVGELSRVIELEQRTRFALINFKPRCGETPTLKNGEIECTTQLERKNTNFPRRVLNCRFICNEGFGVTPSTHSVVQCSINRRWNSSFPNCTRLPCHKLPNHDCASLYRMGGRRENGVYRITPCGNVGTFQVYCDLKFVGGGWTAIQRRLDKETSFRRNFTAFENYFGNPQRSYWIGLKQLNYFTNLKRQTLLVVLTDWFHHTMAYAWYQNFTVEGSNTNYRLRISNYGYLALGLQMAGDSMTESNGMQFTTFDADHDQTLLCNCADVMGSAWWHRNCTSANLNAEYTNQQNYGKKTIHWRTWRGKASLRSVEMFIRPQDYNRS